MGVAGDIFNELRTLFGNPHWETARGEILPKIKPKIDFLKQFVGDKEFALGYLTVADFYLSEYLYYFETIFPSEHRHYLFWWRIRHNFQELSGVQAYYKRPDALV